jgi:hypothetical protein
MDAPSPRPERTKERLRSNVAARRSETCRRRNSPSNRPDGRVPVPGPSKVRVRSFFCTSSGRIPGDGGDPSGATAAAVPRTCTRPLTPGSRRSSPLLIGGIRRPCRRTGGPRISVPPCSWTLARSRTTLPAGFQNRSRLRRRRRGVGSRANHLVVVVVFVVFVRRHLFLLVAVPQLNHLRLVLPTPNSTTSGGGLAVLVASADSRDSSTSCDKAKGGYQQKERSHPSINSGIARHKPHATRRSWRRRPPPPRVWCALATVPPPPMTKERSFPHR